MSDDQKAIERANAYRLMFELWAWKDLNNRIKEMRQTALEAALDSNDIKDVQMNKGRVRQIDEILSEVDYVLNGTR